MKIARVVRDGKSRRIGLIVALVYFLLYLYSINNLTLVASAEPGFRVVDEWGSKVFRSTAPYLWESVAVLNLPGGLSIFISIPNLILAGVLSILVLLNISTAMYTYYVMPIRPGLRGLIGLVPSLFTGFVCCIPTFIITLGAISTTFTVFFIEIRQYLMPISLVVMLLNLVWSLRQINSGLSDIYEQGKAQG